MAERVENPRLRERSRENDSKKASEEAKADHAKMMVFPVGEPNDGFAQYFSGQSYLAPILTKQVGIYNVNYHRNTRCVELLLSWRQSERRQSQC